MSLGWLMVLYLGCTHYFMLITILCRNKRIKYYIIMEYSKLVLFYTQTHQFRRKNSSHENAYLISANVWNRPKYSSNSTFFLIIIRLTTVTLTHFPPLPPAPMKSKSKKLEVRYSLENQHCRDLAIRLISKYEVSDNITKKIVAPPVGG